ncbi:MAG TPA: 3-methyladenine DNA glycosylase [Aldersonia sp.]
MTVLAEPDWTARAARHRERVAALIGPYLAARRTGTRHPVIDFLFTYYPYRPAQLERWHPGFGVLLTGGEYASSRGYCTATRDAVDGVTVDPAYLRRRRDTLRWTVDLLAATASRPARLGCFGLHEWAMVYRSDRPRHQVPLRLGRAGTDAVVESMPLRCTHYDAYRFFTAAAAPRNAEPLSRDRQFRSEQPGCLHATMDLYRVTVKLMPLLDSDLLADTFELAYTARELDMRASPYDLSGYGYTPVQIETPAGRAQYVREQQKIASRGDVLRATLLERCRGLLAA